MVEGKAIVLTEGILDNILAKTCHGLLRGSDRFEILAVIDAKFAGKDACSVAGIRGRAPVPVFADIDQALENLSEKPDFCIVGVALHGGKWTPQLKETLFVAARKGMSLVNGLHSFLNDDPEFLRLAQEQQIRLIDVRKPLPFDQLQFWSGEVYRVKTPKIAVLGTDCAVGKRTTCRFLLKLCIKHGIRAEMIYTGQTGWMEGYKHGFIFDSTLNDFVSGEIERVILECERESKPDLMLIEGQSALRNPAGPCGAEFLLSGNVKGVVLQHVPGRRCYDGVEGFDEAILPSIESEIELIKLLGAETLAIAINEEGMSLDEARDYQKHLSGKLGIPVVRPLEDGMEAMLPVIQEYMKQYQSA